MSQIENNTCHTCILWVVHMSQISSTIHVTSEYTGNYYGSKYESNWYE